MRTLILRALDCDTTEDTYTDQCRLEISIDDQQPEILKHDLGGYERWVINRSFSFQHSVTIKLYDEDWPDSDDFLGSITIDTHVKHRAIGTFTEDDANYTLWYEVVDPAHMHRPPSMSLRQMLGRLGHGVLTAEQYHALIGQYAIYRCSETIRVRDVFRFHAQQDRGKGNTKSVKTWINRHCNPWGEESVIPVTELPRAYWASEIARGYPDWTRVHDEQSYCVAGFQQYSRKTNTDNPISHETLDWNWLQIVDPPFTYMLSYTAKQNNIVIGETVTQRRICEYVDETPPRRICYMANIRTPITAPFPYIENEWETGSMPIQWRPFWGEYVTTWGRHIYDRGHMPIRTEIHPAHTMVREHTTAAPLGRHGEMVPANRAIIGMGLSGGFPRDIETRWQHEFDGKPDGIWGDTTNCWPTNLKKHPLKYKLYPPVSRPSDQAVLKARIVLCEYIQVADGDALDDFLEFCQYDDPAAGGKHKAFRDWHDLPTEYRPQQAPVQLRPKLTLRNNAYFDVEVDLASASQIPVGYYAIIEYGWDERGDHTINAYDITFETIKAVQTEESWDDWHIFYGVNGQWSAWWTDDYIEEGETYTKNTRFQVWTIDNMPLLFRDTGIEWDGGDCCNEVLDRVEITAQGPDHFGSIRAHKGVEVVSSSGNTLRFKARGWEMVPEATKHEWIIKVVRRTV